MDSTFSQNPPTKQLRLRSSQVVDIPKKLSFYFHVIMGGWMTLLEAVRNEERKLAKEVSKVQRELNGIRAAAKCAGSA